MSTGRLILRGALCLLGIVYIIIGLVKRHRLNHDASAIPDDAQQASRYLKLGVLWLLLGLFFIFAHYYTYN